MFYGEKETTRQKVKHLLEIPEEELAPMRDILNAYISKNRNKHKFMLKKSLLRRLGSMLTDELLDDILQSIYVYAWQNIERVMEFHKTGYMDRYFLSLFYNIATVKRARLLLGRDIHYDIYTEYVPEEETPETFTNYALDVKLPNEERMEYHRIALDETKLWLLENPHSKLKKALDVQKNNYGPKGYAVALNYVATPSYSFLTKNKVELNLTSVQGNIDKFKKVCSEIYGKDILKQCEMPTKWT